ncbi:MAG TPA: lipid II flippase MurJ, partial [Nitrococcus sp.]|nr:lipid II flippase MurJ [Nitrococcus sp.]
MPALSILVAVLLTGGIEPLVWGTLAGFILQALFLYMPLAQRGEAERPLFAFHSDHWRVFFAGLGVMLVGQALMSLVSLLDQFFAARLGAGALSTLGYTNRILSLILGLGAVAVGRALLPVLSRAHAEGRDSINRIASHWAALLFVAGLGVTVIGVWLAPVVVKLLFQRGQFTAEDSVRVTELLRFALVQIPFYFSSMALIYALLSQGRYKSIAALGGANLLIKLILAIILVPTLALKGLMLSTAGVYLGSCFFAAALLQWMTGRTRNSL